MIFSTCTPVDIEPMMSMSELGLLMESVNYIANSIWKTSKLGKLIFDINGIIANSFRLDEALILPGIKGCLSVSQTLCSERSDRRRGAGLAELIP